MWVVGLIGLEGSLFFVGIPLVVSVFGSSPGTQVVKIGMRSNHTKQGSNASFLFSLLFSLLQLILLVVSSATALNMIFGLVQ